MDLGSLSEIFGVDLYCSVTSIGFFEYVFLVVWCELFSMSTVPFFVSFFESK